MLLGEYLRGVADGYDPKEGFDTPQQELLRVARFELHDYGPTDFVIRASGGQRPLSTTHTPWIGFFDPDESQTPQEGLYVVWLLRAPGDAWTLSLNMGTENRARQVVDRAVLGRRRPGGGAVRVVRVAEEISSHVTLKPYPKSRAGRRAVPLPRFTVEALTRHCRDFGNDREDLVFTASTGEPLKRGTFRARVWKPSLQRAGLSATLRFHDLRHSYATWLVSDGVPINDVARIMGHEQTSTTLNLYTHSTAERDRRVLRSFDAYALPPADDDDPEETEDPSEEGP